MAARSVTYESVSMLVQQLSLDDKHRLFKMLQFQHSEEVDLPHHFKHKCDICRSLSVGSQCAGCLKALDNCENDRTDSYECMICANSYMFCHDSEECSDQAFAIFDSCPKRDLHTVCIECALQSDEKYIRCTECEASLENPQYQSRIKAAE